MSNKNPKSNRGYQSAPANEAVDALTDMDYMSLSVDHDIAVVPIFDLEYIASDRVRGH